MAGHAMTAMNIARLPFLTNFPTALRGLLATNGYPPLVYLVSVPLVLVFWPTADVLTGVNALFIGILLLSTFGIARAFGRRWAGLLAAFMVSMYPIIYGLARHYLLDIPLVAMVSLSIWLLVLTQGFERRIAAVLFGLALGLGVLTKWTLAVFVGGPLLVVIAQVFRKRSGCRLFNLALALALAAIVAAPWYLYNLSSVLGFLKLQSMWARSEGDPLVGSWAAWLYYLRALANEQILLPFLLLSVAGLVLLLTARQPRDAILLLLGWIVLPYAVFSIFINKDPRFTLPCLPAIGIMTAWGLMQINSPKVKVGLIILTILYAAIQFTGLSWGLSRRLPSGWLPSTVNVRVGAESMRVYAEGVHIANPARTEDWQAQNILHDMLRFERQRGSKQLLVLTVLPNRPYFESNVFSYYALSEQLPIHVQSVTGIMWVDDARQRVMNSDYVVAKTGDQGPAYTVQDAGQLTDELQDSASQLGRLFVLMREYPLPDGSVAKLYQRKP